MMVTKGQVNAPAVAALAMSTLSRLPRSFVFHRAIGRWVPFIVSMMGSITACLLCTKTNEEKGITNAKVMLIRSSDDNDPGANRCRVSDAGRIND